MTTNTAALKISPSKDAGSLITGPATDPEISLPKTSGVSIQIVSASKEADHPCAFWVGLMAPGKLTPHSLMDFPEATAILTQASIQGVLEIEPVMLSDSRFNPPRTIYLVPQPPTDFRNNTEWIHDTIRTVTEWCPGQIGIYIAPSLIKYDSSHELLLMILRELIAAKVAPQFFLFTGEYGLHSVLNAALRLKMELAEEPQSPPVLVYH